MSHSLVIQPSEIVSRHLKANSAHRLAYPLANAALLVPDADIAEDVVFQLKPIAATRVEGSDNLNRISQFWDVDFQSDIGVNASIGRVSAISQDTVLVQWNVTWVPPTALWLEGIGKLLGLNTAEILYITYNHLAQKESTLSWNAVFKLFGDAFAKRELRVPLACIEGTTELVFSTPSNSGQPKLIRVSEDLSYAIDLKRGVLRNRKCAQDLRLFLETGRRLLDDAGEWDDIVAISLPWGSVPGSNPLDVDPVEEGPMAAIVFIGIAAFAVIAFASVMGPELIGQSLFGPPNYIVRPEDLGSFY